MKKAKVCITAAIGMHDRSLGKEGKLLWHISDDLKRFKKLTLGHPVIMGRKTYESISAYLGGPLPGRTNIVVTRSNLCFDGCLVFNSFESALTAAHAIDTEEVHIGGGAEMYATALPFTDRLYLTLIDDKKEADAFFPEYHDFTKVIEKEDHLEYTPPYTFITLERT